MSDKVYVGQKVESFQGFGAYEPFSRVTMWYDDEHYYTAGDDSGRELECSNPWATQEIVDGVLSQVKGYVYRPYEAKGAEIDPAAEAGDAVTVGGIYSVIGTMTRHMDAMALCDIGTPGSKEIDHEYPYKSPQEREMKRRVKLEQTYYGAKISRREGLVIEKTDGETVSAKAVLNADELSFYDAGNKRVLYFDPTSGTYKFLGELNVNDKFVVDKYGNVKMAGNLNLAAGTIYWGDNPPNKKRYAASTDGPWHDTMQSGDIYCCDWDYKTNVWGEPYKFKGQDGTNGTDGKDALGTWENVKKALSSAAALKESIITINSMGAPEIYGGKIYGTEIYAGDGSDSFAQMDGDGFYVYVDGAPRPKISMVQLADGQVLQIILGTGSSQSDTSLGRLFITKGQSSGTIYYVGTGGAEAGFKFNDDGTISVMGELKGVQASFG